MVRSDIDQQRTQSRSPKGDSYFPKRGPGEGTKGGDLKAWDASPLGAKKRREEGTKVRDLEREVQSLKDTNHELELLIVSSSKDARDAEEELKEARGGILFDKATRASQRSYVIMGKSTTSDHDFENALKTQTGITELIARSGAKFTSITNAKRISLYQDRLDSAEKTIVEMRASVKNEKDQVERFEKVEEVRQGVWERGSAASC